MRLGLMRIGLLLLGLFFLNNPGLAQRTGLDPGRVRVRPASGPRVLNTQPTARQPASPGADRDSPRDRASDRLVDSLEAIRATRLVTSTQRSTLRDDLKNVLGDSARHHPLDSMANDLAWAIAGGAANRASLSRLVDGLVVLGDPDSSRGDHHRAIEAVRRDLARSGVSDRDQQVLAIHLLEISARLLADRPAASAR